MRNGGIYIIKNCIDDKIYVGSSKCFHRRYQRHRKPLLNSIHTNKHLQNAFNKHGADNFKFLIIEIIEDFNNLLIREQNWLDELMSYDNVIGYNIDSIVGPIHNIGKSPSEETRRKISESLINKHYSSARKGVTLSDEIKNKISDSLKKLKLNGYCLPQSIPVKMTNVFSGEVEVFESMTDVNIKYGIDRTTMYKYNGLDKLIRNVYKIEILNDQQIR
jgi:group I intron endonuclease